MPCSADNVGWFSSKCIVPLALEFGTSASKAFSPARHPRLDRPTDRPRPPRQESGTSAGSLPREEQKMKGICQSGSQLHHYFPFFASGAKRQATRLCSAALLLPSSSSLRSDSGGGGVQSDKFSSNPLSPSTVRSSFLRPQPCGRSTLGRDEGGRPVLEGGLFREGIFSQNSCQEVGERAVEPGVQGPDKTTRGDLPLPPPEAKAGKMQSRGKWEESFQRPRRVYVRI